MRAASHTTIPRFNTIGRPSISNEAAGLKPEGHRAPARLAVRVFVLFLGVYLCTWAGHYTSGDGSYKVAWAKAMFLGGAAAGTSAQATVYSKYGIGHSLLAVAPLALAHFV